MTPFAHSQPFTVGVEEELLVVDPLTLRLAPSATKILQRMTFASGEASHEAYAAQIELRSPPSTTSLEAVATLADLRIAAIDVGATLMGVGVHPIGTRGDAALLDDDRYRHVEDTVRGLIRRTPESALHIHVGMPDAEAAIHAYNGLRPYLPLLQALSANSPWWFGSDSGLASARYALVRSYPGRGIPRALRDYDDWEQHVGQVTRAGGLDDYTFVWSDIRLHPRHGTVEVREMDAQASLEHVGALAALVRALAREAVDSPPRHHLSSEALAWSCFRAARDGINATILWDGAHRSIPDLTRSTVERLRPTAEDNGDEAALLALEGILAEGGGAARQRKTHADGGIDAMLRSLVDDTHRRSPSPATRFPVRPISRTGDEAEEAATGIAHAWLEARSRGDLGRVAQLTAENATWDSPVEGLCTGRQAVIEQIRAAFTNTDSFKTELISLQVRGSKGAAVIRNTGRRGDENLDSLQTLFLTLNDDAVTSVRIAVDDPDVVEAFWMD